MKSPSPLSKTIQTELVAHRGEQRIKLMFDYNKELINKVKQINGARWSKTMGCWHVPVDDSSKNKLLEVLSLNIVEQETAAMKKPESGKDSGRKHNLVEIDEYHQQIFIQFLYKEDIKNSIKKMTGAWWHPGKKVWSVNNTQENLEKIQELFISHHLEFKIHYIKEPKKRYRYSREIVDKSIVPATYIDEMKLVNKSENTIRHYTSAVAGFLDFHKDREPGNITIEEIKKYILHYREKYHYSPAFQNQTISALKLFYQVMYNRNLDNELPRPRTGRKLPKVISKEEVERMMLATNNIKHKLILIILYGCGLRLRELINLKIEEIDFLRKQLIVLDGKGKMDRAVGLPARLEELIRIYIRDYVPRIYLLNGQGNIQYSAKSIGNVIEKSAKRANIKKRVTPHILRHCYATHMLEKGISLRYIQYSLGHKSSRTTEIYTHISNKGLTDIGSPLDDITLK